ncbi:MAG: hypothetical protein LUI87_15855 [Lachnospiraceae bacterium]|nr:hypothetical protein [Lachnospiraceae bacterium]
MQNRTLEGRKMICRFLILAGILVLAGFALYLIHAGRVVTETEELVADSIEVTWTNEDMEQIDLTGQAKKEKIARLLDGYVGDGDTDHSAERDFRPHKGDLEISVKDNKGEEHYIYLSKEGDHYCYSKEDGNTYEIPQGDELYQEVAAAL